MRFKNLYEVGKPHSNIGILLVNLGTPTAPNTGAVRRYLREFLSDPRVVEIPKVLWQIILNGVILQTRPKKSARAYQKIWTDDGSPLLVISRQLARALKDSLAHDRSDVMVEIAMRYGTPSIEDGLEALANRGCGRVLVLPLYPQYSAATTASIFDEIATQLAKWRTVPEIRFINSYYNDELYIEALAAKIQHHWQQSGTKRFLLMSFHGLPKRNIELGDPYRQQSEQTASMLAKQLNLKKEEWCLTFQSRFGPATWLQPYTNETLEQLAKNGMDEIDVVCPGFAADCLETLEEIAQENRDLFLAAGGKKFAYIPALNDSPQHIACLRALCLKHTRGWEAHA